MLHVPQLPTIAPFRAFLKSEAAASSLPAEPAKLAMVDVARLHVAVRLLFKDETGLEISGKVELVTQQPVRLL